MSQQSVPRLRCTLLAISVVCALLLPAFFGTGANPAPAGPAEGRASGAPWWDSAWKCRRPITLDSTKNAEALRQYQLQLDISYESDMSADFSDIRFVWYNSTSSRNEPLPYWLAASSAGVSAKFWACVPYIPAAGSATIQVYFGNGAASSLSDPSSVFDLYDDFTGNAIDTAKWTVDDSTGWSVSGGELKGTTTTGLLHSKLGLYKGSIVETRTRGVSSAGNSHNPLSAWASTSDLAGFYWGYASGGWGFYSFYADGFPSSNYNWKSSDSKAIFQLVLRPDNTCDLVKRDYNTYAFKEAWSDTHNPIAKTISGDEHIRLGRRCDDGYRGQSYEAYWDWVRVRKYAPNEPAATIGAKEYPLKFKTLGFSPKDPSERDPVTLSATFNNPGSGKVPLTVSFHEGDDFESSRELASINTTLNASSDTVVSAVWKAVGGRHRLWVAASGTPLSSVNVSVNRDPVLSPLPDQTLTQGKFFRLRLNASDADGDQLLWACNLPLFNLTQAENGSAELSLLPQNEDVGEYPVNVTVTDAHGRSNGRAANFTVKNVNDPPAVEPIPAQTAVEHVQFSYQVRATDPDLVWGDKLRYSEDTSLLDIDPATGVMEFTPGDDDVGTYDLKVFVSDNRSTTVSAAFKLTVANVNDPPRLAPIPAQIAWQGRPFSCQLNATDPDLASNVGEDLRFSDDTALFEITPTGQISFTPHNDDVGAHVANITVTDRSGEADTASLLLNIININDPPAIDPIPDLTATEDIQFSYRVNASDPDLVWRLDNLTFSDDTDLFDIQPRGGLITFMPRGSHAGEHRITITVSDEHGSVAQGSFTLTVIHVNHPPFGVRIMSPGNGTQLEEGQRVTLVGTGSDNDAGDILEFSWLDNGKQVGAGENITIGLKPGKHRITLEVSDGSVARRATVDIEVRRRPAGPLQTNWAIVGGSAAIIALCAAVFVLGRRRGRRAPAVEPAPAVELASAPAPSVPAPEDATGRDQARQSILSAEDLISDMLVDGLNVGAAMQNLDLAREFMNEGEFSAAQEFAGAARSEAEKARARVAPEAAAPAGRLECPSCGEPLEGGWSACPACMHRL